MKIIKFFKIFFLVVVIVLLSLFFYLFIGNAPKSKEMTWGVDFSQMQAESLGLNWKDTYLAILEDLGVKNIKLHTQWDWVEGKRGDFYFDDIDWQIDQSKKYGANIIYVVGMKTGRWPECHLPKWSLSISKDEQQRELLEYIKEVVFRYKDEKSISYWHVENEPLFNFGECPWYDREFLKKEVSLVKSIDPERQIIISDSGELSSWISGAEIGDILGVTLYRKVWFNIVGEYGFYWDSVFPPVSYWRKAQIVEKIFNKKVIGIELQAEPWAPKPFFNVPILEQEKTMNISQFKENIQFARETGLDKFYLWGVEWWYWLKEIHNRPEIWNEAKELFKN